MSSQWKFLCLFSSNIINNLMLIFSGSLCSSWIKFATSSKPWSNSFLHHWKHLQMPDRKGWSLTFCLEGEFVIFCWLGHSCSVCHLRCSNISHVDSENYQLLFMINLTDWIRISSAAPLNPKLKLTWLNGARFAFRSLLVGLGTDACG